MKKTLTLTLALVALALACAFTAPAAQTQLFGTLTTVTVNNTSSNSPAISLVLSQNPSGYIQVTHGALTNLTSLTMTGQLSLDGTNFVTATAVWTPTTTAATTENWTPSWTLPPLYFRSVATTTNNVNVGTAYVQ